MENTVLFTLTRLCKLTVEIILRTLILTDQIDIPKSGTPQQRSTQLLSYEQLLEVTIHSYRLQWGTIFQILPSEQKEAI